MVLISPSCLGQKPRQRWTNNSISCITTWISNHVDGLSSQTRHPAGLESPMATAYLTQMLRKTQWPELDYLLIDMPPGTGDIQLAIVQKMPITAAVLITTPQCLSLADLEKGYALFQKMHIPIVGVIENMARLICSQCGHPNQLFANANTDAFIRKHQLPQLGSLALSQDIADSCEKTRPYSPTLPTL